MSVDRSAVLDRFASVASTRTAFEGKLAIYHAHAMMVVDRPVDPESLTTSREHALAAFEAHLDAIGASWMLLRPPAMRRGV